MKILIVGAGAIGGYFGGRLLQAGRDVTFLVRPRRAAQLAQTGLVIKSPAGDFHHPNPPIVQAENLHETFDLVLLGCKAYDLDGAIRSFAPAVGPATAILPLLNGMRHLDVLEERFGRAAVLGGLCVISTALDEQGQILHLNDLQFLAFGERGGTDSAKATPIATAIATELAAARVDARLTATILQEMWEKWVFIASGAGITCLMRAPIGDIVAAGGAELALALIDECATIATSQGFAPSEAALQRSRAVLTTPGSPLTASMLRDIERGGATEAEHVLGDLLRRGSAPAKAQSLLRAAYVHLAAYEARRLRTAKTS